MIDRMSLNNNQQKEKTVSWHALAGADVFTRLHTNEKGLTFKETRRRKRIYGLNQLKLFKKRSAILRFLNQFNNLLIYVLLATAVITSFLKHWIDTGVIIGVVVLNALIGFIQEGKAEKALLAIRNMLSPKAIVIRGGHRATVPAKSLVPGDIVLLQPGDKVPADLRLFNVKTLQIQEAILTGESNSVTKVSTPVSEESVLAERLSMAYSGTLVTYGRGEGVVVGTGACTEIGRISAMIAQVPKITTPLLRQLTRFSRWLTIAIIILAALTFAFGALIWNDPSANMFMAVVSLAVAAIPEGLPAILTITLAIGVTKMAKRNAIIRRLPAVETMGSVTSICTDKTGTLTRNELAVQKVVTSEHVYHVTGSGYNATGEFHLDDAPFPLEEHRDLLGAIRASMLCNDAELIEHEGKWQLQGNPVDGALLSLALKAKMELDLERGSYPHVDMIPFASENKLMASLHHDHTGHRYVFVKGAPERILERCCYQRYRGEDVALDLAYWNAQVDTLAQKGLRIVAIAVRPMDINLQTLTFEDIKSDLTLLGLFGLIDPPREEVIHAVSQCQSAGIHVKMVTGDHALTAKTIGEQVGIGRGSRLLTGSELDHLTDQELEEVVEKIDIYARTSPEHKLRLVKALQSRDHVVAMTGDGVNDAPALKQADIGVAMGIKGTEATKEVAEMVLADDNFASIYHAVEEGRTVYDNLKKAILYILPTNGGEAFIIVLAIILGHHLPITAVQILWVNLITAVTFALALAFEPSEEDVMRRLPRSLHEPILSKFLMWRVLLVTVLLVACGFGLYLFERSLGVDIATARTVVVNMFVVGEGVYLFNCRKLYQSAFHFKIFFGSIPVLIAIGAVVIFQLLFTYLPVMQHFFGSKAMNLSQWAHIFVLAILIFMIIELEKYIMSFMKKYLKIKHE